MPASPQSDSFVDWCRELLAPLGPVRAKRMFGGHGLYIDEVFVAIVIREVLYLKVDDSTRPRFEAAGSVAFEYTTATGARGVMSYFSAPAEAMEAPSAMLDWARLAMASALRARASKPVAKKPAKKPAVRRSKAG